MTMTNAEWMIENGYNFSDIRCRYELDKTVTFSLNGAIVGKVSYDNTCLNTFKAWLDMEHKEPILDDAERRYLSTVIRPFRDRVIGICKTGFTSIGERKYQYVFITLCDRSYNIDLPLFEKETMYKGMELGKAYTLEELGL